MSKLVKLIKQYECTNVYFKKAYANSISLKWIDALFRSFLIFQTMQRILMHNIKNTTLIA